MTETRKVYKPEEKLCEIVHENVRYILRRNPVRAREIETGRNSKVEKIRKITDERNQYLSEHPKAEVSTALSLLKGFFINPYCQYPIGYIYTYES